MPVEIRAVLLSEEQIRERVAELAARISADYAGRGEVLFVGVLRGAFLFLADLVRRLEVPAHIDFVAVSSYGQTTRSTGAVRLLMDVRTDVAGKHVVVVEDIVDTGHTLRYLLDMFAARKPASLKACSFLRKPGSAQVEVPLDYLGFDIPDLWVVGYGLDCFDEHRNLPYVAEAVPPDAG
jgi:hypoxanthine phosphoribosyltransferase